MIVMLVKLVFSH